MKETCSLLLSQLTRTIHTHVHTLPKVYDLLCIMLSDLDVRKYMVGYGHDSNSEANLLVPMYNIFLAHASNYMCTYPLQWISHGHRGNGITKLFLFWRVNDYKKGIMFDIHF